MIVRLENIADLMLPGATTQTVNLNKILAAFGADGAHITEVTWTGNMEMSEMKARKVQWKTRDDDHLNKIELSYGDDYDAVQLELQRIRTFKVVVGDTDAFLQ